MSLLAWLFSSRNPYSGPLCEQLGHHSFEWHYGWNCYVCLWCGVKVTKDDEVTR